MGKYQLREVKTAADARKFIRMAERIYQNDPMWVQPLDPDIENVFNPQKNPLFHDGEAIRWTLHDASGTIVGRIAAFYNRELSANEPQPTGGCGFFECIDDQEAANTLFDAAREWLAARGLEAMDGSINFGDRMQWWGVLVEGFTLPLYGMNYNPPYYARLFETYGFQNYFNQHTYLRRMIVHTMPEALYQKADRLFANPDYRFDHVDLSDKRKVARDLMEVYNSGWATFSGVKPMEFEHALQMVNTLAPVVDPEVLYFAFHKEKAIGFFVMIPDLNLLIRDFRGRFGLWQKLKLLWRLKVRKQSDRLFGLVFGVAAEFQGRGVEAGMIRRFEQYVETHPDRYNSLEIAWIGDFNPLMMRVAESYVRAEKYKRHVTYRYLFDRTKPFERAPKLGKAKSKPAPTSSTENPA